MVPEAKLSDGGDGLVPASKGWFVLNVEDARWSETPGMAQSCALTGRNEYEGQERPVKRWDFVHCPPETRHAFVGGESAPLVLLCASSRQFQKDGPWGFYCADETAAKYNASSPEDTQDGSVAYARFGPSTTMRYPGGLLP